MRKLLFIYLFIGLFCAASYASTSADYAISAEVFDYGGASMESTGYLLTSKLRDKQQEITTSAGYTLESRFLGMVSVSGTSNTLETPVVTSITPNTGTNNKVYTVIINGINISTDATAQLVKGSIALSPVSGTLSVESSTSLECNFDLSNVQTGKWDVDVINTGWGNKTGVLAAAFSVTSPGAVKILGVPLNDPNPFNPDNVQTHIRYKLSTPANISLYMFNQLGQLVWKRDYPAGNNGGALDNDILWDGISDFHEDLPTGVYVLRIINKTQNSTELGKVKLGILRR